MAASRKLYDAVAKEIQSSLSAVDGGPSDYLYDGYVEQGIEEAARAVARAFAADNPAFDYKRFLGACGVEA